MWKNKIIIGFGTLFSVLFVGLSSSACYAISDYSVTYTKSDVGSIVCYNNNTSIAPVSCSDYSFIKISYTDTISNAVIGRFYAGANLFYVSLWSSTPSYTIIPITSSLFYFQFDGIQQNSTSVSSTDSFTVTLMDSLSSCPPSPSGSLSITENGTFDVTNYASAVVDVPPVYEEGDYHDDLVDLNKAIYVVPATLLVMFFFWYIFRMFIKSVGGL